MQTNFSPWGVCKLFISWYVISGNGQKMGAKQFLQAVLNTQAPQAYISITAFSFF